MIYLDKLDKDYLAVYFAECDKKGHKISEWGGETCCSVCGNSSYILHKWAKANKILSK